MRVPIRVAEIGTGSTVNVSSSGVAFMLDAGLAAGTPIAFSLIAEDADGPLVLQCGGMVVRTEPRDDGVFAAATIEQLVLRTASAF